MKFYNREKELSLLEKIRNRALKSAQMSFVVGRRRIGKTTLLVKSAENTECVYFFVARKNEALLCEELIEVIRLQLNVEVFGTFKSFKEVFGYLMELSKTKHFTLILDEFQEFLSINPSVYSDMQNIWDKHKEGSRINLILCGSVYSLMKHIFENSKEPLFGRATQRIHLKAFDLSTIKEIMKDHNPNHTNEDLLAFYMITGGVAKYVEQLIAAEAYTFNSILDEIFSFNSIFINEGQNVLIDEFGKEYGNYFSILSLIASSKTSRVNMESILEIPIGGFLDRLEYDYGLIRRVRSIFAKPTSRSVKYQIHDNFLNFWFRFIYKYRSTIEIGNLDYVKDIVNRDYKVYSGRILEKYFTEILIESGDYSQIGTYWEKANKNEIDIVAVNERKKKMVIAEVKRQSKNISIPELQEKSKSLIREFSNYKTEYIGFSMDDM
ncbi:MAG: AAA family ATPase [Bacteroidales bacterium]|nr:AAA family ATPase [Bacteroidales bacterium]